MSETNGVSAEPLPDFVVDAIVRPPTPEPKPDPVPQFGNSSFRKRSEKVKALRFRVTLKAEETLIPGQEFAPRPHKAKELIVYGRRRSDVLDRLEEMGISGRKVDVIKECGCIYADGRIDFGEEGPGKLIQDGAGKAGTVNPFSKG